MKLTELLDNQKGEYNRFVASSSFGSFLQSWEWGQWQEFLGREVYRFQIQDDAGVMVGLMQLIKMSLPFGKYYLYAPYGPVVNLGFKIDDLRLITQHLRKKFPEAIFIRIEPKDKSLISNPLSLIKARNIQPGKTLIMNLKQTEEELLAQMHHKTRYNIRLAQKHGVEIKDEFDITIGHGLFAKEAAGLIVETASRQGYKGHSPEYYSQLVDFFTVKSKGDVKLHIYKAIYQKQLLASAIMLDFAGVRTFLFGGSVQEHKNVMAPYLMHWQAMLDAQKEGMQFYDWWGTETSSGQNAGFVRFKLGFGGSEKEYGGANDIILQPFLYKMYCVLRRLPRVK